MKLLTSAIFLSLVATIAAQDETASPDAIAKLVAQLGSSDFRTREEAGKKLEKLGAAALPELRKAKGNQTPEANRRVDLVLEHIESGLLKAEEKTWKDLDASRRSIRARVVKMVGRMPKDEELVSAIYLVSTGQRPSDAESAQAQKQLKQDNLRLVAALKIAHGRVVSKQFNPDIAAANASVLKMQAEVLAARNLAEKLQRINNPDASKLAQDVGNALNKAAKTDALYCDLAYLVTHSRFPLRKESKVMMDHLKLPNRAQATADIVWALVNSASFLMPSN